jgi:SAM-dependent methyltransferase
MASAPSSRSTDPLAGSSWSEAGTVAGFAQSPPNDTLLRYAAARPRLTSHLRIVDIGCGAGRNAVPLAQPGSDVVGIDLSWPMLTAAAARVTGGLHVVLAPMDALPVRDGWADLVIAHGIWNLGRSASEFRQAVREAARIARPGAALFVFTFSRHTLPPEATPVAGEAFVFTQFSGRPQVFLTEQQLIDELGAAGFIPDPALPLREHNLPPPGQIRMGGAPVIYEGGFVRPGA